MPCTIQAPAKLLLLLHISNVITPCTIVLIIKGFVKFCGCIKIKLRIEVIYAIFKFVLLIKKRNNIPLKKNSSVNDSTKLTTPKGKYGLKTPPHHIFSQEGNK